MSFLSNSAFNSAHGKSVRVPEDQLDYYNTVNLNTGAFESSQGWQSRPKPAPKLEPEITNRIATTVNDDPVPTLTHYVISKPPTVSPTPCPPQDSLTPRRAARKDEGGHEHAGNRPNDSMRADLEPGPREGPMVHRRNRQSSPRSGKAGRNRADYRAKEIAGFQVSISGSIIET